MTRLGQTRFNEFLDSIEGINPKTLSARLREMGKNGIIEWRIYPGTPVRIEYSITQKGKALKP
ncbi:MAG: helix-turn-helix transcriptional regulator, partial [Thaumarchaeota archaeon]